MKSHHIRYNRHHYWCAGSWFVFCDILYAPIWFLIRHSSFYWSLALSLNFAGVQRIKLQKLYLNHNHSTDDTCNGNKENNWLDHLCQAFFFYQTKVYRSSRAISRTTIFFPEMTSLIDKCWNETSVKEKEHFEAALMRSLCLYHGHQNTCWIKQMDFMRKKSRFNRVVICSDCNDSNGSKNEEKQSTCHVKCALRANSIQ